MMAHVWDTIILEVEVRGSEFQDNVSYIASSKLTRAV